VLLRNIHAWYIIICKQRTGSVTVLYYNRLKDILGIALLYYLTVQLFCMWGTFGEN